MLKVLQTLMFGFLKHEESKLEGYIDNDRAESKDMMAVVTLASVPTSIGCLIPYSKI